MRASAVIEVADDGPGIAPEFAPRLFERFSKADAARTGAGSGLGLAIARENAVLLGGSIAVASPSGGGATFTVALPALDHPARGDSMSTRIVAAVCTCLLAAGCGGSGAVVVGSGREAPATRRSTRSRPS